MTPSRVQPDLFSARGNRSQRPSGAALLLPRFLAALRARGWVAGAILAQELGADLRTLRDAAHESGGRILGGQRGYCITTQASLEDVTATVNRLYSQAREMRERAVEIERVRHSAGHGDAALRWLKPARSMSIRFAS